MSNIRLLAFLLAVAAFSLQAAETALDRYVAKPDPTFSWKLANKIAGEGQTTFVIELTSQTWLTTNEVDKPVWKHWLTIIKPDQVASPTGLLFIGGGNNDRPAPGGAEANLVRSAVAAKAVVAELKNVPNQPLVFKGDGKPRVEDALIAYTWDKFLRTGDEKWPARLPMTKSAVRAMDAVTAFLASEEGGSTRVDSFVVAGGSKRGWTTWTTAIVDKRVKAIVPIVIDMLNVVPSFDHHYEAYGFWAPAVGDYQDMGIMDWAHTKEYDALMDIEEPYEYRDRLTLPKLMINATGDQFFVPDSAQFYWKDLKGPKWIRYVPNADHSLRNSDAHTTLLAFYWAQINGKQLPELTWTLDGKGNYEAKSSVKPAAVKLWQGTNPNARDFRLETIGAAWKATDLTADASNSVKGTVNAPAQGWTGYMVEFTYDIGAPAPLKLTTEVRVTPDRLPFAGKVPRNGPKR